MPAIRKRFKVMLLEEVAFFALGCLTITPHLLNVFVTSFRGVVLRPAVK